MLLNNEFAVLVAFFCSSSFSTRTHQKLSPKGWIFIKAIGKTKRTQSQSSVTYIEFTNFLTKAIT